MVLRDTRRRPPHALAFSPDASKLFAIVSDSNTNEMDFHVLDQPTVSATVSLSPSQQTILGGGKATLTAQITGTSTGTIDLYGTPTGRSKTLVTTGTVGSDGSVSFTVSPVTTATYSAVLEPGPGNASATSQNVTVTVVPRSMPLAASQRTVTYGGKAMLTLTGVTTSGRVNLYGTYTPFKGQVQAPVLLKTAAVPDGRHSVNLSITPKRITTYLAEREDRSAASNDLTVIVRPLLVFAVHAKRISPKMVRRHGEKVLFGAIRKPPLQREVLTLEIDRADAHGAWRMVACGKVQVGPTGGVVAVLTIKETGRYRARMSSAADTTNYTSARSVWRHFRVG